jgi:hypothetical protein
MGPEGVWTLLIRGPKRPRVHSPGFTLDLVFGPKGQESLAQGKLWAKLSSPFGAGSSGRRSGAKQIRCSIAIKMGSRQIGPSRIGGGRQ